MNYEKLGRGGRGCTVTSIDLENYKEKFSLQLKCSGRVDAASLQ